MLWCVWCVYTCVSDLQPPVQTGWYERFPLQKRSLAVMHAGILAVVSHLSVCPPMTSEYSQTPEKHTHTHTEITDNKYLCSVKLHWQYKTGHHVYIIYNTKQHLLNVTFSDPEPVQICRSYVWLCYVCAHTRSLVRVCVRFLWRIRMYPGGWIQASPSTCTGTPSSPRIVIFTVRHCERRTHINKTVTEHCVCVCVSVCCVLVLYDDVVD